jgi:hypothetical protein
VEHILSGTVHGKWIPVIRQAILSMYFEAEETSDIGLVVDDADCLDLIFVWLALIVHFLDLPLPM